MIRSRLIEFGWVALGQLCALAGGIAAVKVMTVYLAPEGYGRFILGITVANIMVLLAYGPLSQVVARFYPIAFEENQTGRVNAWTMRFFRRATLVSVPVLVTAAVLAMIIATRSWLYLVLLGGLLGAILGLGLLFSTALNAGRLRKWFALYQGSDAVLKPVLAVALVAFVSDSPASALLGYCVAALSALVLIWVLLPKDVRLKLSVRRDAVESRSENTTQQMRDYVVPFTWFAFLTLIGLHGDKLILQGALGSAQLGIYAAMYQIANAPVVLVLTIVNQFALPLMYSHADRQDTDRADSDKHKLIMLVSVIAVVLVCVVLYIAGEQAMVLLASRQFSVYHEWLWVLSLGIACFHLGQQLNLKGYVLNRPEVYVWPKALHSLAFLLLGGALAFRSGVPGVCIAYLGTGILYLLMVGMANQRLTKTGPHNANHNGAE